MQRDDVSEFDCGGKKPTGDPADSRRPENIAMHSFFGFAATDAAVALLAFLVGKGRPQEPTPEHVVMPVDVSAMKVPARSAFGPLPLVTGSTAVTFRN